jgi:hypothetical protein
MNRGTHMKIKAIIGGFGAALVLAVSLSGLSGTAAADPKEPSAAPSPVPAERRSPAEEPSDGPSPVPAEEQTPGPKEPVTVKPAYTG